jgi:hypothetical protein
MRTLLHIVLGGVLAAPCATASAVDVAEAAIPGPVADGTLSIGGRTLSLPDGTWMLVGRSGGSSGRIDGGGGRSERIQGLAVAVADGAMAGAVLYDGLGRPTSGVSGWQGTSCVDRGALHFELIDAHPLRPECVIVQKGSTIGPKATLEPYRTAAEWAAAAGTRVAARQYTVSVARYGSSDRTIVRVVLPQAAFASDADAIAWARLLARAMHPLLDEGKASLPPLPAPPRE